jgi:enolase
MIKNLSISKISNACNRETIKLSLKTSCGVYTSSPPMGTSVGEYEAKTLDIEKVFKEFPKIKKNFIEKNEKNIDKIINKLGIEKIGANLSLALSIAGLKAISNNEVYKILNPSAKIFPFPLGNVIGGGAHHGYTSEQEFLIAATKAKTIEEAVQTNFSIWNDIGKYIKSKGILMGNNYEGAWMCKLNDIQTLDLLSRTAEHYEANIGIDFASYETYKNGYYSYLQPHRKLPPEKQLDFIMDLIKTYKIFYVEDPFHEDDFKHFAELTKKVRSFVVGDDIFATQPHRLKLGIKMKAGNAIVIKPNQVGTISKTLETVKIAKKSGYATVVSHRSGDTTDDFIADLAVGIEAPLIKCGIYGKERKAKLDRLIEIWNKTENPRMSKLFI